MRDLIQDLQALQQKTSQQEGPYWLFALVMRDADAFRWDLLVSAPWLEHAPRPKAIKKMSDLVVKALNVDNLLQIGRVIVLRASQDPLASAFGALKIEGGTQRFQELSLDGFEFDRAIVFRAFFPLDAPHLAEV